MLRVYHGFDNLPCYVKEAIEYKQHLSCIWAFIGDAKSLEEFSINFQSFFGSEFEWYEFSVNDNYEHVIILSR